MHHLLLLQKLARQSRLNRSRLLDKARLLMLYNELVDLFSSLVQGWHIIIAFHFDALHPVRLLIFVFLQQVTFLLRWWLRTLKVIR